MLPLHEIDIVDPPAVPLRRSQFVPPQADAVGSSSNNNGHGSGRTRPHNTDRSSSFAKTPPSSPKPVVNGVSSSSNGSSNATRMSASLRSTMIEQFNNSENTELSLDDLKRIDADERRKKQQLAQDRRWDPEDSDYSLDHVRLGNVSGQPATDNGVPSELHIGERKLAENTVSGKDTDVVFGLDYSLDIKLGAQLKSTARTDSNCNSNSSSLTSFESSFSSVDSCDTADSNGSRRRRQSDKPPRSPVRSSSRSRSQYRDRSRNSRSRSKSSGKGKTKPSRSADRSSKSGKSKRRAGKAADVIAAASENGPHPTPSSPVPPKSTLSLLSTQAASCPLTPKSCMKKTDAGTSSDSQRRNPAAGSESSRDESKDGSAAKKVQFYPRVRIKRVVNRKDLNLQQINRIWYSRDDFKQIRQECFDTIRLMNQGDLDSSMGSLIWDDDDSDDDGGDRGNVAEFCPRGLEYKTTECYHQRQAAKREIRTVVFEEQEFQREQGMVDTTWIAKLSEEQSRSCVLSAIEMAEQDARDAQEYLFSDI